MNDHFKKILDDATNYLGELGKQAEEAVGRAKRDMSALAAYAEELPQRMLDTCSHIFIGELKYTEDNRYSWQGRDQDAKVSIHGLEENFLPYNGGTSKKIAIEKGKYRVIVVLQKVE